MGEAIRRYPLVFLVPLVALAALSVVVGVQKTPAYTATAQVAINQPLSPNAAAALPAEVQAAQVLASNDSRLIQADEITAPLARQFHTTSLDIANRLSATPIPSSALIEIIAEGENADSAVRLANAAAEQFSSYVTAQLQSDTAATKMLHLYQSAALTYSRIFAALQRLEKADKASAETLAHASAASAAAQLREQTLAAQYASLVQSHATAPTISAFLLASGASSDRRSTLEIYVLGGVLAGLMVGAALAAALANRGFLSRSQS